MTSPPSPWVLDAEVESTPLSTTGGHTWAAARRLAAYLSAAAAQLGLARPGLSILELGSGTGWLGVTAARNLPHAAVVCLTEQPDGLAHLRSNVGLNAARGLPLRHVRVQACDWREFAGGGEGGDEGAVAGTAAAGAAEGAAGAAAEGERAAARVGPAAAPVAAAAGPGEGAEPQLDLRSIEWDFILGSDLIYNDVGSRCLPRVLAALAQDGTQVLYCHTKHRFDLLDIEFFEQLAACGLACEEVWEPGVLPPEPPSPPVTFPPTTLFPEQRIAVYRITRRRAVGGTAAA